MSKLRQEYYYKCPKCGNRTLKLVYTAHIHKICKGALKIDGSAEPFPDDDIGEISNERLVSRECASCYHPSEGDSPELWDGMFLYEPPLQRPSVLALMRWSSRVEDEVELVDGFGGAIVVTAVPAVRKNEKYDRGRAITMVDALASVPREMVSRISEYSLVLSEPRVSPGDPIAGTFDRGSFDIVNVNPYFALELADVLQLSGMDRTSGVPGSFLRLALGACCKKGWNDKALEIARNLKDGAGATGSNNEV